MLLKYGVRNSLLFGNFISGIATVLKLILWEENVYFGHFLFGLGNGVSQVNALVALYETIPCHWFQSYGTMVFIGLNLGFLFNNLLGLLVPYDQGSDEMCRDPHAWVLLVAFPMLVQTFVIIFIVVFYPFLSLTRLVQNGPNQRAFEQINKTYKCHQDVQRLKFVHNYIKDNSAVDNLTDSVVFESTQRRRLSRATQINMVICSLTMLCGVFPVYSLIFKQYSLE